MPGPAPQSKTTLALSGSWRAKHRGDDAKYPPLSADPPEQLKGEALAEWHRLTTLMEDAGTLREVDRAVLAAYCECWSDCILASSELENAVAEGGYAQAIAAGIVNAKNRNRAELLKLATALGITPASATRVTVKAKPSGASTLSASARKRDAG